MWAGASTVLNEKYLDPKRRFKNIFDFGPIVCLILGPGVRFFRYHMSILQDVFSCL